MIYFHVLSPGQWTVGFIFISFLLFSVISKLKKQLTLFTSLAFDREVKVNYRQSLIDSNLKYF